MILLNYRAIIFSLGFLDAFIVVLFLVFLRSLVLLSPVLNKRRKVMEYRAGDEYG